MGRGRAKAKQTKVARQLKYNSPQMDLDSLARELGANKTSEREKDQDFEHDEYSEYAERYADYGDWEDKY